jgi:hypothetical protein
MLPCIPSATLHGVDGKSVSVELHVSNGLPAFTVSVSLTPPFVSRAIGFGQLCSRAGSRGPCDGSRSTSHRQDFKLANAPKA